MNVSLFVAGAVAVLVQVAFCEKPDIKWQRGPIVAQLGKNIAQIEIDSNYLFTGPKETRKLMEMMGNPPTDIEVGLITTAQNSLDWFVVFEYNDVGYVKDTDKGSIDADAILRNITEGTEASNKKREEMGGQPLRVIGWYERPHYNEATNNLVWAIIAESRGDTVVNYNTRLLGRGGYTSVVIVASVGQLDSIKPEVETLMEKFSYKSGKKYAEFVEGDKMAKYGLTALVAGGAGVAAAKLGLFKMLGKMWKVVVIAIIAFFASLKNFFLRLFGMKKQERRDLHEQKRTMDE